MRFRTARAPAALAVLSLFAVACGDTTEPDVAIEPPAEIDVRALSMSSIGVSWLPVDDAAVTGYRVQRRTNLEGEWETLDAVIPQADNPSQLQVYFDEGLEPETFYGYRVFSFDRLLTESKPSIARAAATPPLPGVLVSVRSDLSTPTSVDVDGFLIELSGNGDTLRARVEPTGERRLGPLSSGEYGVELSDLAQNCSVDGPQRQAAHVRAEGVSTVDSVSFLVKCRDPGLGQIIAQVEAEGDTLPERHTVLATAILDDSTFVNQVTIPTPTGGTRTFDNLPPGTYEVALAQVPPQCILETDSLYTFAVGPLSSDTARFEMECYIPGEDESDRQYVLRNTWSPNPVGQDEQVTLLIELDMSNAAPGAALAAFDLNTSFDPALLRIEGIDTPTGADAFLYVNNADLQPGIAKVNGFSISPLTGSREIATINFTVLGDLGETQPSFTEIMSMSSADGVIIPTDSVGVVVDTLLIGSGGPPGPQNEPPVADAGGPYNGTAGVAINFDGSGSTDSDGTITSYSWDFDDGNTGSGETTSHTYTSAGTYQATLTVTDDDGDTDNATAQVTVVAAVNQPPVADPGGPYSALINETVTFDGSGSFDDGTIVSYTWDPGDQTGTLDGVSPSHVYSEAGFYTASLTVVDDEGASTTANVAVNISDPSSSTPFSWISTFEPASAAVGSIVELQIVTDFSQDLSATDSVDVPGRFRIDSLMWDPSVVRLDSLTRDCGACLPWTSQTFGDRWTVTANVQSSVAPGVINIATLYFTVTGGSGGSMAVQTFLGYLESRDWGGARFDFIPYLSVSEGTLTVP